MTDRAQALLALWNDVDPALDVQYNEWHAEEHVPQRLTVPGILWGLRYRRISDDGSPRYLTLYGLRHAEVLESEPYQRLLRDPTPMSLAMRPALRNVSRWVCALHQQPDLDHKGDIAVWTGAEGLPPARVDGIAGCLLAKRIPAARPLPWLQAGQTQGIEGRWLVCASIHCSTPPVAQGDGVSLYARLPVGSGTVISL